METGNKYPWIESRLDHVLHDRPSRYVNHGSAYIIGILLLFALILSAISMPRHVASEAKIYPFGHVFPVYSTQTAYIDSVLVHDREYVYAGQVLAVLDSEFEYDAYLMLLNWIRSQLHRTESLTIDCPSNLIVPADLVDRFLRVSTLCSEYVKVQESKEYSTITIESLQKQLAIQEVLVESQESMVELQVDELRLMDEAYQRSEVLLGQGSIPVSTHEDTQSRLLAVKRSLLQNRNALAQARMDFLGITSQINAVQHDITVLESTLFQRWLQEIRSLEVGLKSWKARNLLIAPSTGMLRYHYRLEPGDQVSPERSFASISKSITGPEVILRVPIQGAGQVKEGQRVIVHLFEYPSVSYGTLQAIVGDSYDIAEEGYYGYRAYLTDSLTTSFDIALDPRPVLLGRATIYAKRSSLLGIGIGWLRQAFMR